MKHLALIVAFGLAFAAQADIMLYWGVDLEEGSNLEAAVAEFYKGGTYPETLYATIEAAKYEDGTLGAYQALDTIVVGSKVDTNITGFTGAYDSYVVKLYNANEKVAYSTAYNYSDLIASSSTWATDTMGMKADTAQMMQSLKYRAAPEPTSGLLMLLGLAGLALKRKNV